MIFYIRKEVILFFGVVQFYFSFHTFREFVNKVREVKAVELEVKNVKK